MFDFIQMNTNEWEHPILTDEDMNQACVAGLPDDIEKWAYLDNGI